MSTRIEAMSVYCPECGAAIEEPCLLARTGKTGREYRRACHSERHRLFERARDTGTLGQIQRENQELIRS